VELILNDEYLTISDSFKSGLVISESESDFAKSNTNRCDNTFSALTSLLMVDWSTSSHVQFLVQLKIVLVVNQ
jgi:hypothetical protein